MSYRFMRVLVFFDLPTDTASGKREYRKFRKMLIKTGFVMMQESVYSKIVLNSTAKDMVLDIVRKNKPPVGLVQALTITEKQFAGIDFIVGTRHGDVLDTDERMVVL